MALSAAHAEMRRFGRRKTQLLGKLKRPGRSTLEVVIKNLSQGGALIDLGRPEWVPYGFYLTIEGDGHVYGCEVRHHYGQRIGVEFVDPALIRDDMPTAYGGEVSSWIVPKTTSSSR